APGSTGRWRPKATRVQAFRRGRACRRHFTLSVGPSATVPKPCRRSAARLTAPSMLAQFKEFAIKGNVVDMAVGIMIGAAFTSVVKGLVDEVLTPPLGLLLGNVDFSDKFLLLKEGTQP